MNRECRKIPRYAIQLPCAYGNIDRQWKGTVLNLSPQGCTMSGEELPPVSSYLSLEIDLLNGEPTIHIELAAVRWVSGDRCGVEFIRISPDTLLQLKSFALLLEASP